MDRMHKREQLLKKKRQLEIRRITHESKRVMRKYAHSKNVYVELAKEMIANNEYGSDEEQNAVGAGSSTVPM